MGHYSPKLLFQYKQYSGLQVSKCDNAEGLYNRITSSFSCLTSWKKKQKTSKAVNSSYI